MSQKMAAASPARSKLFNGGAPSAPKSNRGGSNNGSQVRSGSKGSNQDSELLSSMTKRLTQLEGLN